MGNTQPYVNIKDILIYSQDTDVLQFSNRFINQDITEQEFLSLMKPEDIRTVIYKKIDNFSILFSILIYNLHETSIKNEIQKDDWKYIHNNLKVLIRILPILSEWEFNELYEDLLWYKCIITRDPTKKNTLQGIALLTSLSSLMQKQDFTLKYTNIPWEYVHKTEGKSPNNVSDYYQNRVILMQTLIALFGSTLQQPNNSHNYVNPFISFFTCPQLQEQCINLFDSLLGTATKHKEYGYIPFQNMLQGSQLKQQHASLACQLASLLMTEFSNWQLADQQIEQNVALQSIYNYLLQIKPEIQELNREQQIQSIFSNFISSYYSQVQEEGYVTTLLENILNLLENPIKYQEQVMPDTFSKIQFSEELLIILSKFSTKNIAFYQEIIKNKQNLIKLFKVIMYYFCISLEESKTNSPFFVCLSILIHFSQTEEFGNILSLPLEFSFPYLKYFPVVGGNNGDFIINCISQGIINGHLECNSIYVYNQMALLLNISPNLESLQDSTASKLIQLLLVFTNYDFLLQNIYHPHCLIKLIQVIDHIISQQYKTNIYLIYLLCQNAKLLHRSFKINFEQEQIKAYMGDPKAKETLLARKYKQRQELKKQNPYYKSEFPFEDDESQTINDPKENQNKSQIKSMTEQFSNKDKEDLLNYWSNYDWITHRSQMPTKNIKQVLKQVQDYMEKNTILELDPEVIYEMISKENLNVQSNLDKPYIESFVAGGVADVIIRNQVWMNIFTKSVTLPWFDPEKCLFFKRINMDDIQNNKQNNSLDVEHSSSQDIKELPKIQPQNGNQQNISQDDDSQEYNQNNQNYQNQGQGQDDNEEEEEEKQNINKEENSNQQPQEQIPQRQGNQQHPNNLYIISEADSRKEDTMMFNSNLALGFRMNTVDQDESRLRAQIQQSGYKSNSQKNIEHLQFQSIDKVKSENEIKSPEKLQNPQKNNNNNNNPSLEQIQDSDLQEQNKIQQQNNQVEKNNKQQQEENQEEQNIQQNRENQINQEQQENQEQQDKIEQNEIQENQEDDQQKQQNQQIEENSNKSKQDKQKQINQKNKNKLTIEIDELEDEQNKIQQQIEQEKQNYEMKKQENEINQNNNNLQQQQNDDSAIQELQDDTINKQFSQKKNQNQEQEQQQKKEEEEKQNVEIQQESKQEKEQNEDIEEKSNNENKDILDENQKEETKPKLKKRNRKNKKK